MVRSHRLFELMQALRRHRNAVSGAVLAEELGVSLRTIRRDVATLQSMGADIEGEAGIGYLLRPGFLLPPLSFTDDEIQALVIGAQWVSIQTDDSFASAVKNALAKINAVLPKDMRSAIDDEFFHVGQQTKIPPPIELTEIRRALREQRKIHTTLNEEHTPSESAKNQLIWPIMFGFIESKRYIAAWCELDGSFQVIGMDAIQSAQVLEDRYPGSRYQLIKQWRTHEIRPCNSRPR